MKLFVALSLVLSGVAMAAEPENAKDATPQHVKYRAQKEINFEQLIIEGQLKRPELSVVTGESEEGGNGLLRLRENFMDRMASDAGEELP